MERRHDERFRLLARSHLLESGSEEDYDRFTRLAAMVLLTPVSLVTLVDKERQYFKSFYGLPEPWSTMRQTPLTHSFCQYVATSLQPLIVSDAREDSRLKDNLAIPELGVIAYLGFPLIVKDQALGSFCVIDNQPRVWSAWEITVVRELAHFVGTEIALRIEMGERQKVTSQLQTSEERFRTLANQAPIMIWQADTRGEVTFANATWCTFTGLAEKESLGSGWTAAVHPDDLMNTYHLWKRMLKQQYPFHSELRVRRADGIYCPAMAHGSAYRDEQGHFQGYIGTVLDISDQKKLDQQREQGMSMAAHELKGPLTVAQGKVQLAQRDLKKILSSKEKQREQQQLAHIVGLLESGLESLRRQTRLIDDLLDVSRVQAAKLEFHLQACELVSLARQALMDQQVLSPQRAFVFKEPEVARIWVRADAERTRQVLMNYLTNALKYSPPEKPIRVGLSLGTRSARIWVQDSGIGLTIEQQQQIWTGFYQTLETPVYAPGSPGLGLGLWICQLLMRGQGGDVGVESRRGFGSTFWLALPRFPMDRPDSS